MALSYRPATPVRDPEARALFATASERTRWLGQAEAGTPTAARPAPLAGAVACVLAVVLTAGPVAIATAGASERRCAPVPYALDARLGPPGAAQLVDDVFAEIEVMSGIRFLPVTGARRASAPVRLTWVPRSAVPAWDSLQLGWATARWSQLDGMDTVVSGRVMFRSRTDAEHILGGPVDWYTVARHEIGHLLGLSHQADPGDVMHPYLTAAPQVWSATDRDRLEAIGQAVGCRPHRRHRLHPAPTGTAPAAPAENPLL